MINKKANIISIISIILVFSFTSIIYITFAILQISITNDYILYNMQNLTETLEASNVIVEGTANFTQAAADQYRTLNFHIDDIWFFAYLIFLISTIGGAYKVRQNNYFGFLTFLFYGIMFILFFLTIVSTLTDWFNTEILLKLLPNTIIYLPKFYFYLNNIGIFSAIHIVICLVVNMTDLDFSGMKARKKQEEQALDEEII